MCHLLAPEHHLNASHFPQETVVPDGTRARSATGSPPGLTQTMASIELIPSSPRASSDAGARNVTTENPTRWRISILTTRGSFASDKQRVPIGAPQH